MKYCKKCGTQLNDDALFCKKCGTASKVFVSETAESVESEIKFKFCIKCGAQLKADAEFCSKCGAHCKNKLECITREDVKNKAFDIKLKISDAAKKSAEVAGAAIKDASDVAKKSAGTAGNSIKDTAETVSGKVSDIANDISGKIIINAAEESVDTVNQESVEIVTERIEEGIVEEKKSGSRNKIIIVAVIAILVLAVAVVAFIILRKQNAIEEESVEVTTVEEVTETVMEAEIEETETLETETQEETENSVEESFEETTTESESKYSGKTAVSITTSEEIPVTQNRDGTEWSGFTTKFQGIDEDGNVSWEIDSGFLAYAELSPYNILGIRGEYGYIYCGDIMKVDMKTGSVVWKTHGCGGSPIWKFDSDDALYIIGYYDTQLYKIDSNGNLTVSYGSGDYYWPMGIDFSGDKVCVTYENPETKVLEYNKSDLLLLTDTTYNAPKYITDDGYVFTDAERSELETFLQDYSETMGMDVVVVSTNYKGGLDSTGYLNKVYTEKVNSGVISKNGYAILIDTESMMVNMFTSGQMRNIITDDDLRYLLDMFISTYNSGEGYAEAVRQVVYEVYDYYYYSDYSDY